MRTLKKVFYIILFFVTCFVQWGMSQDTSVWWQDNYTIVVSKQFKGVVPLKSPTGFKVYKGTKYVTVILEMPDSSKSYNVSLAAYPLDTTAPPPDEIILLDNVGPHNIYTGAWTHAANNTWNANHHNKTISYTYEVNATVTVSFNGKKVELFAEKRFNHGIAALSIDSGPEVMIDQYANDQTNNTQKLYEQVLTPGNHTLKLRMTGTKNPAATEANIMFDYIRVTK